MNSPHRSLAFAELGSDRPTPLVDWENQMVRCGIALAGANRARLINRAITEDGLLTGLEASLLNFQGTELVILSACDSGSGELKIGEGVMSLRRAFRIAGAQTVLASYWSVSDKATSELMGPGRVFSFQSHLQHFWSMCCFEKLGRRIFVVPKTTTCWCTMPGENHYILWNSDPDCR